MTPHGWARRPTPTGSPTFGEVRGIQHRGKKPRICENRWIHAPRLRDGLVQSQDEPSRDSALQATGLRHR
jgi:hypothetical protein